jgi:Zn-dependent peptidase ImmA (M78 family)/DNA-binding XRE family transcriptional regulator
MSENPTTLATVRDRLGKSQKEVAERIGVSPSLISKWEKGERQPDEAQIWELARVYGVSASFLSSGRTPVTFRPRSQVARDSSEKDGLGAALVDAAQQIHFVQDTYELSGTLPGSFPLGLRWNDQALTRQAADLRQFLRLNERITYDELRTALSEQDVLVFEWNLPPKLSGLSHRRDLSVVFINAAMPERVKLFTLCHELAHLLYHLHDGGDTEVSVLATRNDPHEKEANRFATELLMPEAALGSMIARNPEDLRSRAGFLAAVNRFGVSPEAMFYRLAQAGVTRWTERERFFTAKKRESLEKVGPRVNRIEDQVPTPLLDKAASLWQNDKVSSGKVAEWLFASRDDVDAWLAELDEAVELGLAETDGIPA